MIEVIFLDEYVKMHEDLYRALCSMYRIQNLGGSMIEVYHNTEFLSYMVDPTIEALKKGIFEQVASVETDSLDYAYQETQNIDQPWHLNTNVKARYRENRSTSVGDLVRKGSTFYVVEMAGFRELTREEECELTFYVREAL